MKPFEVRYLDVQWIEPDTVVKLEPCREPLELERSDSGWAVQTLTFPNLGHYIGIRVTDNNLRHTPCFLLADGRREELRPLHVPGSDEIWWIQKGKWDQKKNRYLSELYRTAGRVSLLIQDQQLLIENNTSNFTVSELEYYLNDFKNSLWMLILDNSSAASARIEKESSAFFDQDLPRLFNDFIDNVEKIIKKPAMVLNEIQAKRAVRSVRPVIKTFHEIVTNPGAKLLTSRDYHESYDTADNQYIHYAVKRSIYILKTLLRISSAQEMIFEQRIAQEKQWLDTYGTRKEKRVDFSVFENEIKSIKNNIDYLNDNIKPTLADFQETAVRLSSNKRVYKGNYSFVFGKDYGKSNNQFFVEMLDSVVFKDKYGTYLVISFPERLDVSEIKKMTHDFEFLIEGTCHKYQDRNSKGNVFYRIDFLEITSFKVISSRELIRLENRKRELESSDWIEPLTRQELQEHNIEVDVVTRKIKRYETLKESFREYHKSINFLLKRIKSTHEFFIKNKIKIKSNCPNSMTFVQNPAYSSAKSHFRKISSINGIDEKSLNSLCVIDSIGLVNISNIYERWCLLKIIHVLVGIFGFKVSGDWQKNLIDSSLNNGTDIKIEMESKQRQQKIILTYEETLPSGKRPDFVLDLFTKCYKKSRDDQAVWEIAGEQQFRLVMDAKFRGDVPENVINDLVHQLYHDSESVKGGKNYSEDGKNKVFIIHPSQSVINNRTSPLEWGRSCDYGQADGAKHRYGSIFLSPTLTCGRTVDNLQRLIGLFLQKHSQILPAKHKNHVYWHNMCCVGCGNSDHDSLYIELSPTRSGTERWVIECRKCGVRTIKTVCVSCQNELFKNGAKWTYHRTRAEQTSNVVCPECETFL